VSWLIDTNIISEVRKGARCNPHVAAWYAGIDATGLYLSVLGLGEIRRGVALIALREPERADARAARRFLERHSVEPPLRLPGQCRAGWPDRHHWLPGGEDAYPLILYLFTSRASGGEAPSAFFRAVDVSEGGVDNARQTGPALEAMYRFMLWLILAISFLVARTSFPAIAFETRHWACWSG
jgi:hypothetical protein